MYKKEVTTYNVYFEQVNRVCLTVFANSKEEAARKAEREWRREHSSPGRPYVEEADSTN